MTSTLTRRQRSNQEKAQHRTQTRQHRRAPLVAVLLLVALSITLAGIFPFRQLLAQQRQVEYTEEKLNALIAENAALDDQIGALETEPEIERLARENYGLVNPGETPYSVVKPEAPPTSVSTPPQDDPIDERTLLERVWDWMTGRDLYPDE